MPLPSTVPLPLPARMAVAVSHGRLSLSPLLIIHLQSGNMTDQPYLLVARNQLTLPADPVSCHLLSSSSVCVAILVHPVAELDRQGVIELPCRSEGPSKPTWHLI
jgi:hypothetical protein